MERGWEVLNEGQKKDSAAVRARWELTDMSTMNDMGSPQKTVVTVV